MFNRVVWIGALLFCAARIAPAAEFFEHSYALVIGIDNYQSSSFPKLSYAVKDAQAIATYLRTQSYDKVFTLYNEQATKQAILEAMQNLIAPRLKENDRVLVFFAGHGSTENLGGKKRGYIVPVDGGNRSASYISMEELETQSSYMGNARHQLFIMDSCFGGVLSGTRTSMVSPDVPDYLREVSQRSARQVITAGGPGQQVLDGGPEGHSFFVDYLLEALQDGLADLNRDGYITFDELSAYLIPRASNSIQTPSVGILPGHGAGEYLFRSPASRSATQPAPTPVPTGIRRGGAEPSAKVRPPSGLQSVGDGTAKRPFVPTPAPDTARFPSVILECECGQCEHGGGGAVWVFEGLHGQAMWRYGAVADLVVEKFDGRNFTMRRVDPVGSYSSKTVPGLNGKPFTAIYTGAIDGNRHVTADVSYNCKLDGDAPEKPCNSSAACPLTSDQVLELGKNAANAGLKSAARQCFRMAASMGNPTAKVLVDEIAPNREP